MDLNDGWKQGLSFTKWTKHLITNLKHPKTLKLISLREVEARIAVMEARKATEKEKLSSFILLCMLKAASMRAPHSRAITIKI